ncbi:MAG: protein TolQ [Pseudomonadota bacterium]
MGVTGNLSIINMISGAGLMVQFVLFVLILFSVVSWAIVFLKYMYIKKAGKESDRFLEAFSKGRDLLHLFKEAKGMRLSPIARLFRTGYTEWGKFYKRQGQDSSSDQQWQSMPENRKALLINGVDRVLRKTITIEINRLNRMLGFLATTGNTAPFVGLFGTVWGIMNAFHGIGLQGSANLATVAPGISEALIATAAGLAAAIPAVIAFNYFTNSIRVISSELDSFASDFLGLVERNVTQTDR